MTATSTNDVYYDPYDVDIDADPYPVFRRLRDEAPIYHNEPHDFYALSRFADVETGLRDNKTYISGRGAILEFQWPSTATNQVLGGWVGSAMQPEPFTASSLAWMWKPWNASSPGTPASRTRTWVWPSSVLKSTAPTVVPSGVANVVATSGDYARSHDRDARRSSVILSAECAVCGQRERHRSPL